MKLTQIIDRAKSLPPLKTAVVWPVDALSLKGVAAAVRAEDVVPVLIGDARMLRLIAREEEIDLEPWELHDVASATAAARTAVALAKRGEVDAIMKGALHTDTFLRAVVDPDRGLVEDRRVSHVFVMDVPSYPRALFITDAGINIYPDLDDKRDIVQNAVDMARALGIDRPMVALVSAVETVSPKIRSTVEAAALCKMAERGQITGGILDGPLALDNAVSEQAARRKGIESPVAGQADILVVPDLEAGNLLAKQLEYLGGSRAAGIALGARVPIVLTSRADDAGARAASCALAVVLAAARRSDGRGGRRDDSEPEAGEDQ